MNVARTETRATESGDRAKGEIRELAEQPEAFLVTEFHDLDISPSATGLSVGYEDGEWRIDQLVSHVIEWLPEFALRTGEYLDTSNANVVERLRRAASRVYTSEKYSRRGEFGELFLHIAVRQVFGSIPAISKIFYKTAENETVKGFDAVHVVGPPEDLELWLGEAKFYKDFKGAAREAAKEIVLHTQNDYLRSEFLLVADKIDDRLPHASALKKLLSPNTSLDDVFQRICIPVLLTYDSKCVDGHICCDETYRQAFAKEIEDCLSYIKSDLELPDNLKIHVFLLPLKSKTELVASLHERLKICQQL